MKLVLQGQNFTIQHEKKIRELLNEDCGYTRLAAVVANPIKHSISPFIHNSAFEATNTNGVYLAWEVDATELAETVANIRRYQMYGINLSMPYKEQVIPYLDQLSEEACLLVQLIQL